MLFHIIAMPYSIIAEPKKIKLTCISWGNLFKSISEQVLKILQNESKQKHFIPKGLVYDTQMTSFSKVFNLLGMLVHHLL